MRRNSNVVGVINCCNRNRVRAKIMRGDQTKHATLISNQIMISLINTNN